MDSYRLCHRIDFYKADDIKVIRNYNIEGMEMYEPFDLDELDEIFLKKILWFTGPTIAVVLLSRYEGRLTLIMISIVWLLLGVIPLYIERLSVAASIARDITLTLIAGVCVLSIWAAFNYFSPGKPIPVENNWLQWCVLILANLAILPWLFMILKSVPITRPLLVSAAFVALASMYILVYGTLVIVGVIFFDGAWEAAKWKHGIKHILGGVALTLWTHFISRENVPSYFKFFIPFLILYGGGYTGLGISEIITTIFPR